MNNFNITITTECICEDYNEDTDTYTQSDYCYNCYDEQKQLINEMITDWTQEEEVVSLQYDNVNWDKQYGTVEIPTDKLIDSLEINTEFNMYFTFTPTALTIVRYSHDEPTGATFIITA